MLPFLTIVAIKNVDRLFLLPLALAEALKICAAVNLAINLNYCQNLSPKKRNFYFKKIHCLKLDSYYFSLRLKFFWQILLLAHRGEGWVVLVNFKTGSAGA